MTIIEQLAKLTEIAPEVCQPIPYSNNVTSFLIGDYEFWYAGEFYAKYRMLDGCCGRPALAWLRDALEQAIEARGWGWECYGWQGSYTALLIIESNGVKHYCSTSDIGFNTPAEALLGALIKAVK